MSLNPILCPSIRRNLRTTAIVCAVSKDYQKPSFRYWYSFHPYQADFLAKHKLGFLVLGAGSPELIFAIPFKVFEPWSKKLNTTKLDDGNYYYHIRISCEANSFYLQLQGRGEKVEITAFRLDRDEPRGNMSRKHFIISKGATCNNWFSSWSFVNKSERFVIFGLWDYNTDGKILSEDWQKSASGWKNRGYPPAREHIRLIEEERYQLMTFPMHDSDVKRKDDSDGTAKIGGFTPELTEKTLTRIGTNWYAADPNAPIPLAEEIATPEKYPEGARCPVTINAYERNPKARAACLTHHGHICAACEFSFVTVYGDIGKDFIHVHHIKPIGKIRKEYEIDPKEDLIPVCPNCHAMIHRVEPPLSVKQLRKRLQETKKNQLLAVRKTPPLAAA